MELKYTHLWYNTLSRKGISNNAFNHQLNVKLTLTGEISQDRLESQTNQECQKAFREVRNAIRLSVIEPLILETSISKSRQWLIQKNHTHYALSAQNCECHKPIYTIQTPRQSYCTKRTGSPEHYMTVKVKQHDFLNALKEFMFNRT